MALVTPVGKPGFQAFLYPKDNPPDSLLFDLYPDSFKIKRGTHVSMSPNSAHKDIVEVGGVKVESWSLSVMFDDVLAYTAAPGRRVIGAMRAEEWVSLWVGCNVRIGATNIFRTNLIQDRPMWCAIETQESDILYAPLGIPRQVRWNMTLVEVPPNVIDTRVFGSFKRAKPRRPTKKEDRQQNELNKLIKDNNDQVIAEQQRVIKDLRRELSPEARAYFEWGMRGMQGDPPRIQGLRTDLNGYHQKDGSNQLFARQWGDDGTLY